MRSRRSRSRVARDAPVVSVPSSAIAPAVGRSSSPIRCSSVDLPPPLLPTIATLSPGATSRSTPFRIGSTWPAERKSRRSSRTRIAASLMPQRLHRIEPCRAERRQQREERPADDGRQGVPADAARVDADRQLLELELLRIEEAPAGQAPDEVEQRVEPF